MATKSITTRKTRRAAEGPKTGRRSARPGLGTRPVAVYEAASRHPMIPRVYDPSPSVTAAQQRALQVLARHLYRNDPFIRNLVNAACRLYIGEGPVPLSRFPELDALWVACSSQFDNTGRRSFGDWLRQDVYRSYRIDGEAFVRRRDRSDAPEYDDLEVPIEFECHTSEFCPHGANEVRFGLRYVNGVATVRSKPTSYLFYTDHPGDPSLEPGARRLLELDRSEIYHVHDPLTGGLRGEVLLASALLRAIKLSSLEDAELRRKQVAALMSVFLERPVDAADDEGMLPTEDEVADLVDSVSLTPGGVFQLPYGYKATAVTPADQPTAFETALRWQLMAICASVGMPLYEVLGDDGVERWGRMMSQRVQAQAKLERGMLEHQLLNRMRRDFIDSAMAEGLWTPPEDLQSWELYACEWVWPIIPAARLDQELNALIPAYEKGIITRSHITRTLFGLSPEAVDRVAARDAARAEALGHTHSLALWAPTTDIAARIANRAVAEESAELDLVESSQLEDSILDDDLV